MFVGSSSQRNAQTSSSSKSQPYPAPSTEPAQRELEKVQSQINQLQDVAREQREVIATRDKEMRERDSALEEQRNEIAKLDKQLQASNKHAVELEGSLLQVQQQAEELMHAAQKKLQEAEEKNMKLEEDVKRFQEKQFQALDKAQWMPMDEASIRKHFFDLQGLINSWAKDWVRETVKVFDGTTPEETVSLVNALSTVACFDNPQDATHDFTVRKLRNASRLYLTALLSLDVHQRILRNPFFFFGEKLKRRSEEAKDLNGHKDRKLLSKLLFDQYNQMVDVDEREAHIWRSQFLRLLTPPESATNRASESMRHSTRKRREDISETATREFVSGPARLLLRSLEAEQQQTCLKDLEAIYKRAGELSNRLWTQRTVLLLFTNTSTKSRPFSVDSPDMEAHSSHLLDDPEDHRLDGKRVKLVVHPGVAGFGTHDAEKYDISAVWSKAVVWLDT